MSWSRARRHQTTPSWPTTGPNGGERSSPRWITTPCACSPGRTRDVRSAGTTYCPPISRRSPRTIGNGGGWASPVRRSPRTTSSTTGDPAHRTMIQLASCTPPADAGSMPARAGNQHQPARPRGLLEPYAAMSGTYGSEQPMRKKSSGRFCGRGHGGVGSAGSTELILFDACGVFGATGPR